MKNMNDHALTPGAVSRIRGIHGLSKTYNQKVGYDHSRRLLDLMAHHAGEIQDLWEEGNRHFLVETGDLIVLCLELLLEYEMSMDDILRTCFDRYEKKLTQLLADAEP
ncbi:MAG TPA: hypothetical protein PLT76_09360 [Candidatus Omnitrophota bacterium]|nr:hypothetical protein [Candidatus Omnitrophota bacterium]HQO58910.1 hypothetical protein [Candidatus Omnitrophota bacterium]